MDSPNAVDCFGAAAVSGVYFVVWDAEDLGSGFAVNVHAFAKCFLQKFDVGNGREQAQFNLRIVGRYQLAAGAGDETFAEFASDWRAYRNVLSEDRRPVLTEIWLYVVWIRWSLSIRASSAVVYVDFSF